jgi:hypothetical protein
MKSWLIVGALMLAPWAGAERAASEHVELVGTWHVISHYKDSATANPDSPRWEDRVWTFKMEGDRLRWTDYPIVVLSDDSGRFEGRSRVLAHWEPNSGQSAQLRAGPTVNSRGSKSKALRGSADSGWKSVGKQQRSMSFISYEEKWSIDDPAKPLFTRADILGSGGAEDAEGRTIWKTETVEGGGRLLRGEFDRDGTRLGSFIMTRVGDLKFLSTEGPTPNEKRRDEAFERFEREGVPGDGDN